MLFEKYRKNIKVQLHDNLLDRRDMLQLLRMSLCLIKEAWVASFNDLKIIGFCLRRGYAPNNKVKELVVMEDLYVFKGKPTHMYIIIII